MYLNVLSHHEYVQNTDMCHREYLQDGKTARLWPVTYTLTYEKKSCYCYLAAKKYPQIRGGIHDVISFAHLWSLVLI